MIVHAPENTMRGVEPESDEIRGELVELARSAARHAQRRAVLGERRVPRAAPTPAPSAPPDGPARSAEDVVRQARSARDLRELERAVARCEACSLCRTRQHTVFMDGRGARRVLFVGEAPGAEEDRRGLPFVGRAGELLTDIITKGMGIARDEVHIANVLKCRPPQNRDPMPHEAEACLPYLRRQFKLIQPRAVLVLGRHALERMLPGVGGISRVHGQIFMRSGVAFMPCYHPAAALHNGALLADLQRDFDRVREYLDRLLPPPATVPESAASPPAAEQEQLPLT